MANRIKKEKIGDLVKIEFPMSKRPTAVQLTIHINNLLITYDISKQTVYDDFKAMLSYDKTSKKYCSVQVRQLVNYYGVKTCRKWFKDIYGWEFKRGAA